MSYLVMNDRKEGGKLNLTSFFFFSIFLFSFIVLNNLKNHFLILRYHARVGAGAGAGAGATPPLTTSHYEVVGNGAGCVVLGLLQLWKHCKIVMITKLQ
jgi:hypothetical protein